MKRKIYSIVLLAAGLLIGTNVWANLPEKDAYKAPHVTPHPYCYNMGTMSHKPMMKKAAAETTEEQQVFLTVLGKETMFTSFSAALAALPDNSTPATIKLGTDVSVSYNQSVYTIASYKNITIDLNNHVIYASTDVKKGSEVFNNSGTLIIEDNSPEKGGKITSTASNPDLSEVPGYGSYTIINNGTLILNSGTIENTSKGGASYAVENRNGGNFIMNGGLVTSTIANAIRMHLGGSAENKITMNGGEIYASNTKGECVEIQFQSTGSHNVKFEMNGGILRGDYPIVSALYSGNADFDNVSIIFNGGDVQCSYSMYVGCDYSAQMGSQGTKSGYERVEINGGIFHHGSSILSSDNGHTYTHFIKGGTFCDFINTSYIEIASPEKGELTDEDEATAYYKANLYVIDYAEYANWGASSYGSYWAVMCGEEYIGWFNQPAGATQEQINNAIKESLIVSTFSDTYPNYWRMTIKSPVTSPYEAFQENDKNYIADGFKAVPVSGVDGTDGNDLKIGTLDKKNVEVGEGEKKLDEIVPEIKPDGTTEIKIIPTTTEGKQTIINITEDTKVNKIEVTAPDSKGEAQIVVKDGATLNVGNGGIVSENDILTTVLVESGGTLIVGTNGIDKEGDATPIEIQASEEKGTGTLIFSPNAKQEDTKKYAEVDLYTYCKKVGEKYYWQQFAIPVTGLTNDKVVKTPNNTSYVFEWDYATCGWSQLNNWSQLDEPFAGYDMTNVSTTGGVVYTFKGDLIGNQNIQLTLPHKDYCVMGNSYTAPISIDALFEQISKEMTQGVIERTVYKYDAKAGYYVYTNELEQALSKLGIMNAAFTDIKPMEGFLLNLQNGNTAGVMLNYANAVFTPATKSTAPASAPARQAATTDMTIAKITINSANYIDRMTLVEGEEFSADIENGKDAYKYINEDGINIYAFNNNDKLAMLASDNIEGTNIAFQSAADDEYTLTFQNIINNNYELLDMQTGIRVPMIEGNVYTFYATPNTLNPSRFMVVSAHKMPTGSEQVKAVKNVKGIYTILGQYVGEVETWSSLPQGVYVVNGIKMVK